MMVFRNESTMWHDLTGLDQETTGLLDSLHEVVTALPHIQVVPRLPGGEEWPVAVPPTSEPAIPTPSPVKTRIRPVSGRRPSVFQQRLALGQAVVESEGNCAEDYCKAKRALDIAGALFVLLMLSPVLVSVYLILLITTRGKPIYRQVRLGYQGRPFTMYKFRTMRLDADDRLAEVENEKDGPIFKNRCDPRVTGIGRFLRVTSLDETPQLFNVLLGQMSLVGPRPPIGKEVAQYDPWQRRRLSVMPGLTCLWQVSGRSEIGFQDWVRMDLWYVNHQNLWTDLWLLVKTPWSVLTGRGAY